MALTKNIQTSISLPSSLDRTQRQLVAEEVMRQIRENTRKGLSANGDRFPNYTQNYKETLDFRLASKGSTPNLQQTGDMIADLELLEEGPGYILIGYAKDYSDADKVEGNQIGASGKEGVRGNKSKARPFIGLPPKQLTLIIAQVRSDTTGSSGDSLRTRVSVESILSRFGLGRS